jgi:hypothetical protein
MKTEITMRYVITGLLKNTWINHELRLLQLRDVKDELW